MPGMLSFGVRLFRQGQSVRKGGRRRVKRESEALLSYWRRSYFRTMLVCCYRRLPLLPSPPLLWRRSSIRWKDNAPLPSETCTPERLPSPQDSECSVENGHNQRHKPLGRNAAGQRTRRNTMRCIVRALQLG
jgi:hypothetical protein